MKIGIGIGLDKTNKYRTREQAARNCGCVFYFDARKPVNGQPGVNSPLSNPIYDLSSNGNSATLVNCAGTSADGYSMKVMPNGNTMPVFKADGTDTYATMVNTSSMDITGTVDFAMCALLLTPATIQTGYIIYKGLNSADTAQYGAYFQADGSLTARVNGSLVNLAPAGTFVANTVYDIRVYRIGGRIKCKINGTETYNQADTTSILTQPNLRLFARSNSTDGSTQSVFSNNYYASIIACKGTKCTEAAVNKFCDLIKRGYV